MKNKLTVAFVVDVFDNVKTGGILSAKRFVENLRKHHDVIVISSGEPGEAKITVPGFYIPFVRQLMEKNQFTFAFPKKRILKNAIQNADLVHIQLPFFLGFQARSIAKELGKPIISAFHVQPENILYNIGLKSASLKNYLYKFFVNKFYNTTDAIICPSEFAESELKKHGLTKPSYIVSNGLLPKFKPIQVQKQPQLMNKFVILSVGRLSKDKRHDLLIDAIYKSKYEKSIQLIITGKGPLLHKLTSKGTKLTNKPFISFVSEDELLYFYNSSDLYVHPSDVELESMSVLEAIGCGLPALISDSESSAAKQFALDNTFIFKNGDAADLTRAIDFWIINDKKLKLAKQKYREIALRYQIRKSIRKTMSIYQNLYNDSQTNRNYR